MTYVFEVVLEGIRPNPQTEQMQDTVHLEITLFNGDNHVTYPVILHHNSDRLGKKIDHKFFNIKLIFKQKSAELCSYFKQIII